MPVDVFETAANEENDAIVTLDELRTNPPLEDEDEYSDDLVLFTRDAVIEALEEACRTGFLRRTRTEQFTDTVPMGMLRLDYGSATARHPAPTVTGATINGVTLDLELGLEVFRVARGGLLHRRGGGFGLEADITYEYGYAECPGRLRRAIRMLIVDWLTQDRGSGVPDRATSMSSGDTTYRLVTAGVHGNLFDLPEANAVVAQYRE